MHFSRSPFYNKKIPPYYSLGDFVDFIDIFKSQEKPELTEQIRKVQKDGQIRFKECLILWNTVTVFSLDKLKSFTDTISRDIYVICNSSVKAKGLDQLNGLDTKRKIDLFKMQFPTCLSVQLGSSFNSKFFYSQLTERKTRFPILRKNNARIQI